MKLFEPGMIGKLRLKNRIVMAPMGTRLEEPDGRFSQQSIDYYAARAKGGTGLIATGGFRVIRGSKVSTKPPGEPLIDDKIYVARVNALAEAVHDYGAKLSVQLHAGSGRNTENLEVRPAAPSEVPCFQNPAVMTREMTVEEIERLVQGFRLAAEVASDAGVDCLDVHGHKGGLLDQFMTAVWNRRTDKYGGDLGKRLRLAVEIIEAMKKGAGPDVPVVFRYGL
ncbi:MAG: hypothetical protein V1737_06315, partial [Chloroflexota bacterium]